MIIGGNAKLPLQILMRMFLRAALAVTAALVSPAAGALTGAQQRASAGIAPES
jgi:hypothetical protein